jgi:hypothetical protein
MKGSDPDPRADHVMSQVELLPYHRPHSPLYLVASKFVFTHVFEAFHHKYRIEQLLHLWVSCLSVFKISLIKYSSYCFTSVLASGHSTVMTVSVVVTYRSSISSFFGRTSVGKDFRYYLSSMKVVDA